MATWADLEREDSVFAAFGRSLLYRGDDPYGLAYLATVTESGDPRVHPVCVQIDDGRIFLVIPRSSPKSADLRRTGRYMLHAWPGEQDAEFSFRGSARPAGEEGRRRMAAKATSPEGLLPDEDVFELDIERADMTTWEGFGTPQIRPHRRRWIAR